jgi:hypothetical protein
LRSLSLGLFASRRSLGIKVRPSFAGIGPCLRSPNFRFQRCATRHQGEGRRAHARAPVICEPACGERTRLGARRSEPEGGVLLRPRCGQVGEVLDA